MTGAYYPVWVTQLSPEDGGGFAAYVVDLPGCMSDGETAEEAVTNAKQAIQEWIETAKSIGRAVPEPGSATRVAAESRKRLVEQINEQRTAFVQLQTEIRDLQQKIETVSDRLESEPVWSCDPAVILPIAAKRTSSEDILH